MAEAFLARCGLAPRLRYSIRFVPEVKNELGNCIFGQFRPSEQLAIVLGHGALMTLVKAIPRDDPSSVYRRLPAAELHYSLIVHEVGHAIVHQNLSLPPCRPVHEYVAGLLQVSSMSDASRRIFLESFCCDPFLSSG